jgi:F-type H+-transporting ATPase subunit epsilon
MAATFKLSILTPERGVFEGEVEYVEVPGTEGYMGVLAHHSSLMTQLSPAKLTIHKSNYLTTTLEVAGGFFEVAKNKATVLADAVTGTIA